MKRKIQFNTGRLYQADGQRIAVEVDGDVAKFHDISRMINGTIVPMVELAELSDVAVCRVILEYYDHGHYALTSLHEAPMWDAGAKVYLVH